MPRFNVSLLQNYLFPFLQELSMGTRIRYYGKSIAVKGLSFGSALAIVISWSLNKSILLAIIHGILSWIYVIYYAVVC
jgi:hypothetical protein